MDTTTYLISNCTVYIIILFVNDARGILESWDVIVLFARLLQA